MESPIFATCRFICNHFRDFSSNFDAKKSECFRENTKTKTFVSTLLGRSIAPSCSQSHRRSNSNRKLMKTFMILVHFLSENPKRCVWCVRDLMIRYMFYCFYTLLWTVIISLYSCALACTQRDNIYNIETLLYISVLLRYVQHNI
jgi:hypothetical protein